LSEPDQISFRIGSQIVPFIKHENKPSGHYIFFPITKDGLHYSVHPSGKQGNREGMLAELDLEELKRITEDDFKSLFKYPSYNRDVLVFPISASFGTWFGDVFDIPDVLSRLFQAKTVYVVKAGVLPEFFEAKQENFIVIDPKRGRVMMQFKGNPFGPLNFDMNKWPSNPRMKNMFSINLGIQKALGRIPDSELEIFKPDEFTLSLWAVQVKAILDQVQIVRWNKGDQECPLGPMVDYFRRRRLNLL